MSIELVYSKFSKSWTNETKKTYWFCNVNGQSKMQNWVTHVYEKNVSLLMMRRKRSHPEIVKSWYLYFVIWYCYFFLCLRRKQKLATKWLDHHSKRPVCWVKKISLLIAGAWSPPAITTEAAACCSTERGQEGVHDLESTGLQYLLAVGHWKILDMPEPLFSHF